MSWQDPAPGEREAGDRTWDVVREAYDTRIPVPRRRDWRPIAAVAVAAVVFAAAFTPPGMAVFGSIRDAIRGAENAKPALFTLPAAGRLLVNSGDGVWVVQPDGSKRLLSGYRDASWSPHGLFLAALRGHELRALEPDGDVHWSIARAGVAAPRWSNEGSGDERIAYFAGSTLRVIGGDGRGDRALARGVARIPPAWRPRTHVVAYVNGAGNVVVRSADSDAVLWVRSVGERPNGLEWSGDGRVLLVRAPSSVTVFGQTGSPRVTSAGRVVAATFRPFSHEVTVIRRTPTESVVLSGGRQIFRGAGTISDGVWSPDARWLLLDWTSANQWLFVRGPARRLRAVSNIRANFGAEPSLAGWCCP